MTDDERLAAIRDANSFYLTLHGDNPNYAHETSMRVNRDIEFLLSVIDGLRAELYDALLPPGVCRESSLLAWGAHLLESSEPRPADGE